MWKEAHLVGRDRRKCSLHKQTSYTLAFMWFSPPCARLPPSTMSCQVEGWLENSRKTQERETQGIGQMEDIDKRKELEERRG